MALHSGCSVLSSTFRLTHTLRYANHRFPESKDCQPFDLTLDIKVSTLRNCSQCIPACKIQDFNAGVITIASLSYRNISVLRMNDGSFLLSPRLICHFRTSSGGFVVASPNERHIVPSPLHYVASADPLPNSSPRP